MSYAAQRFMQQDAEPMVGVFVEWRLLWRLRGDRLELRFLREQTTKQLAQFERDRNNNRERESHAARETALRDHQP